jgi:hypothetical protein
MKTVSIAIGFTAFVMSSGCAAFLSTSHVSNKLTAEVVSLCLAANKNDNSDFMRWAKQSRSASVSDTVVELKRPLGLVLNEDESGNVYVETVAPKGNAARTGRVRTNQII